MVAEVEEIEVEAVAGLNSVLFLLSTIRYFNFFIDVQ